MSLYHWLYEAVKMKRWRWVEHIVVGKQGQNRKAWAHLTITSQPIQFFHAVENKGCCWWKILRQQLVTFLQVLRLKAWICVWINSLQGHSLFHKEHKGARSHSWHNFPTIRHLSDILFLLASPNTVHCRSPDSNDCHFHLHLHRILCQNHMLWFTNSALTCSTLAGNVTILNFHHTFIVTNEFTITILSEYLQEKWEKQIMLLLKFIFILFCLFYGKGKDRIWTPNCTIVNKKNNEHFMNYSPWRVAMTTRVYIHCTTKVKKKKQKNKLFIGHFTFKEIALINFYLHSYH